VGEVLGGLLMDRRWVVVDAATLRVGSPAAVMVFRPPWLRAGGWREARMVLLAAGAELVSALRAAQIHQAIPRASTGSRQTVLIQTRPDRVSRSLELPPDSQAGHHARTLTQPCTDQATLERLAAAWRTRRDGSWRFEPTDEGFHNVRGGDALVFAVKPT
jgi:hypothetical protein